jgi:hypothetical protein
LGAHQLDCKGVELDALRSQSAAGDASADLVATLQEDVEALRADLEASQVRSKGICNV